MIRLALAVVFVALVASVGCASSDERGAVDATVGDGDDAAIAGAFDAAFDASFDGGIDDAGANDAGTPIDAGPCGPSMHLCVRDASSSCEVVGDPRACGEICLACEAPDHAIAICTPGGACDFNCRSRYVRRDGGCVSAE